MSQRTEGNPTSDGKPELRPATPADFEGTAGSLWEHRAYPPVGSILAFAGVFSDSPDADWRPCWGQSLLQSDYSDLWKVIGTAWDRGDNPGTTFRLPDLRGFFLRGVAGGSAVRPERETRKGRDGGNGEIESGRIRQRQRRCRTSASGRVTICNRTGTGWSTTSLPKESAIKRIEAVTLVYPAYRRST